MLALLLTTILVGTLSSFSPNYPAFLLGTFSLPLFVCLLVISIFSRNIPVRILQPRLRDCDVRLDDGARGRQIQNYPRRCSALQLRVLGSDDGGAGLHPAALETPPAPLLTAAGRPAARLLVPAGVLQVAAGQWEAGGGGADHQADRGVQRQDSPGNIPSHSTEAECACWEILLHILPTVHVAKLAEEDPDLLLPLVQYGTHLLRPDPQLQHPWH